LAFTFGIAGSNGTKYTLSISNDSTQVATTPIDDLKLHVALRDADNNPIEISSSTDYTNTDVAFGLVVEWLYHNGPSTNNHNGIGVEGTNITIAKNKWGILKATV
jgi:hypothetical protein